MSAGLRSGCPASWFSCEGTKHTTEAPLRMCARTIDPSALWMFGSHRFEMRAQERANKNRSDLCCRLLIRDVGGGGGGRGCRRAGFLTVFTVNSETRNSGDKHKKSVFRSLLPPEREGVLFCSDRSGPSGPADLPHLLVRAAFTRR